MKVRTIVIFGSLVLLLMLTGGWTAAQDQPQANQLGESSPLKKCLKRFESMDKNKDGKTSKEEFMATRGQGGRAEDIFKSKDLNHDGNMTKEEFCLEAGGGKALAAPVTNCKARFATLDTNHDGKLSREEFITGHKTDAKAGEGFKAKDANSDGILTPEEFCTTKGTAKPKTGN